MSALRNSSNNVARALGNWLDAWHSHRGVALRGGLWLHWIRSLPLGCVVCSFSGPTEAAKAGNQ